MNALALSISEFWPTRSMMKILSPIPNCSLWPGSSKEARYPQLPKTTTTGNLNVTHSHSQGNLFPSRRLKGSHTFTAQSIAVEDCETEEDSGPTPKTQLEERGPHLERLPS